MASQSLLSDDDHALINQQRSVLVDLLAVLAESGASQADVDAIKGSLKQLEQLFLICIVGEFNVGKSTFINALLGGSFLQEGPTPTTADIWKINYGERASMLTPSSEEAEEDGGAHTMLCPVPFLRDCQLVDTPGTNVIIDGHRQITDKFIPQADLVLFLTSADRPFTESETQFIRQIQAWSKKIVFVINKADIFRRQDDLHKVR